MKLPKQTAPIARNLHTTAQAAEQNGVEASGWRDWVRTGIGIISKFL